MVLTSVSTSFKGAVSFIGNIGKIIEFFRGLLEETLPQIFLDIYIILGEAYIHDFCSGPLFGIVVF